MTSLLRIPDTPRPGPRAPQGDAGPEDEEASRDATRRLRCRSCGASIASEDDFITIVGSGPQVFVNPHGLVFEIVTVCHATNLFGVGRPTPEFTWFPGYAWRVVVCALCTTHLGWAYQTDADASPPRFYGLIRSELTQG